MTDHRPRRPLAPIAVVAIAAGLLAGFGLGRLTAPSDLERLTGIIAPSERPAISPPPDGIDNDGELLFDVDANGRLDVEGLRLIEQVGESTLGLYNGAAEPVILVVEQENPGGSGDWEVIYSERIEAGSTLVGRLPLPESGSYRLSSSLASAPDSFSTAFLSVWTPE
jgi:hypothetical protein